MSVRPRLFVAAATTLMALGAGAALALATAPALATGRGPAAQEALKLQPTIKENIGPIRTAAQKRKTIDQLLANAKKSDHAAQLVSRTHPQITNGRDLWVKGVRLQAAGDRELAAGLRLILAGNTTAGQKKVNAAANAHHCLLNLSRSDVSHADGLLGIDRALPMLENG